MLGFMTELRKKQLKFCKVTKCANMISNPFMRMIAETRI